MVFPLVLAVVCHEWAHGYVAAKLGDDTAARMGRLTLNPLAHVDVMGTLLIPGLLILSGSPFLFGYAKPVPVVWHRLRNPLRDMVYVAAAGPAMNFALAVVSAVLFGVLARNGAGLHPAEGAGGFQVLGPLLIMCAFSVQINVLLGVFNLIPIPPLDGGRVAVGLLPRGVAGPLARSEPYGFIILVVMLMTGTVSALIGPVIYGIYRLLGVL